MEKPLELIRLDAEESALRNGIFYRCGPLALAGRDGQFSLRLLAHAAPMRPALRITLDCEGALLAVDLASTLVPDRLVAGTGAGAGAGAGEHADATAQAASLDPELRAALYEVFFEGLLDRFQDLTGSAATIAAVEFFAAPGAPTDAVVTPPPGAVGSVGLELALPGADGAEPTAVPGRILYSLDGLRLLARAMEFAPASAGPDYRAVAVACRAEIGVMTLTLGQAELLAVGDVLLPDAFWYADNLAYLRVSPRLAFRCAVQRGRLVIQDIPTEEPMQEQDARPQNQQAQEERPDEAAGSAAAAAAPDLADLELSVVFELGEKRLTLAELEQLRPGMTFDLGKGLAEPVTIRVNGTAVGTGEPVQVGDRVGVRIVKLS